MEKYQEVKQTKDSIESEDEDLNIQQQRNIITENDPPPKGPNGKYPFSCKINEHGVAV